MLERILLGDPSARFSRDPALDLVLLPFVSEMLMLSFLSIDWSSPKLA
jgi:hypothetical protein|tara:strand:- start:846 stop:989 length:144 start_codon:yes stop_codon:yes gene_type:complete